jgi:hypothetical protein
MMVTIPPVIANKLSDPGAWDSALWQQLHADRGLMWWGPTLLPDRPILYQSSNGKPATTATTLTNMTSSKEEKMRMSPNDPRRMTSGQWRTYLDLRMATSIPLCLLLLRYVGMYAIQLVLSNWLLTFLLCVLLWWSCFFVVWIISHVPGVIPTAIFSVLAELGLQLVPLAIADNQRQQALLHKPGK